MVSSTTEISLTATGKADSVPWQSTSEEGEVKKKRIADRRPGSRSRFFAPRAHCGRGSSRQLAQTGENESTMLLLPDRDGTRGSFQEVYRKKNTVLRAWAPMLRLALADGRTGLYRRS